MGKYQKIRVKIKPGSKNSKITKTEDMFGNTSYDIKVKALPKDGEANKEMLEILSDYFYIPKSHIQIKSGHTSRNKVILVPKS